LLTPAGFVKMAFRYFSARERVFMDKISRITGLLAKAGIEINGSKPWDMQINDSRALTRIMTEPSLGAGESYMDGWWDCPRLDKFFFHVLRHLNLKEMYPLTTLLNFNLKNFFTNSQSRRRSKQVAEQHYNLDNGLYTAMLGESMAYTCAYWRNANSLDEAQFAKYDLICRKLDLHAGEKVLELGCGFGGFAKYAAEKYGVEMVSINISTEQMRYARQICRNLPVRLVECDYRDVERYNPTHLKFDKLVSIGLCEHIGYKNYKTFLKIARANLKEDGLFLLHTIAKNISEPFTDPWVQKYIFPQGMLPTLKVVGGVSENYFVPEDVHNIGTDYDRTLMAWHDNFERAWSVLSTRFDERFHRMWRYYLLSCAGGFRAREMQLYQFVFSPRGQLNGYGSIR
jgi:cyclopropane-fatty-acyl-phospholipid synthase